MKSFSILAAAILPALYAVQVTAHGYLASPPSRAALCRQEGSPTACGAIQYEPQSVEAVKGLPFARSGDGRLCSAGVDRFPELDRQGKTAWKHQKPADSFQWNILVPHSTTDFKYYITKPGWNSAKTDGLRASDLDPTPFMQVKMNGKQPSKSTVHKVQNMPQRSGYHMVYAVWTIADTNNAFYQCLDLDFGGGNSGGGTTTTVSAPVEEESNSDSDNDNEATGEQQAAPVASTGGSSSSSPPLSPSSNNNASGQSDSKGPAAAPHQENNAGGKQHHHHGHGQKPASKGRQHFNADQQGKGHSGGGSGGKKGHCRRSKKRSVNATTADGQTADERIRLIKRAKAASA